MIKDNSFGRQAECFLCAQSGGDGNILSDHRQDSNAAPDGIGNLLNTWY